jgi:hypothetical protein
LTPSCSRCSRTHNECRYPNSFDTDFRDENKKASKKAKKEWRQRSGKSGLCKPCRGKLPPSHMVAPPSTPAFQVFKHPLKDRAICLFYHDFGCTTREASPWTRFFKLIPDMCAKSPDHSPILFSVSAVAYLYLGRKQQTRESELLARRQYCQALRLMNDAIQVRSEVERDETLIAVYFLILFETLSSSLTVDSNTWDRHLDGAVTILQFRSLQQFGTLTGKAIVTILLFHVIISCLKNRNRPKLSLGQWAAYMPLTLPARQLINLMYQATQLFADMKELIATVQPTDSHAKDTIWQLVTDTRSLDQRLMAWESEIPLQGQYVVEELLSNPRMPHLSVIDSTGAPKTKYIYRTTFSAFLRTFYFSTRILLNESLLQGVSWLAEDPLWLKDEEPFCFPGECESLIARMTENISRSIPSLLRCSNSARYSEQDEWDACGLYGMFMLWPLRVALCALDNNKVEDIVGHSLRGWMSLVQKYVYLTLGMGRGLMA